MLKAQVLFCAAGDGRPSSSGYNQSNCSHPGRWTVYKQPRVCVGSKEEGCGVDEA